MPVSTFLITVNTQQTSHEINPKDLETVMELVHDNITSFLEYRDKMRASSKYIDSVEVLASCVEIGGEKHRVHNHSVIQLHHRTKVQLRRNKIERVVSEMLGLSGMHINIQFVPDSPQQIEDAINYCFKSLKLRSTKQKRKN